MTKFDFGKVAEKLGEKVHSEQVIEEYKSFYLKFLDKPIHRKETLASLISLIRKFEDLGQPLTPFNNDGSFAMMRKGERLLQDNFGEELLHLYNSVPKFEEKEISDYSGEKLATQFLYMLIEGLGQMTNEYQREFQYKKSILKRTYECLSNYGLHPAIQNRTDEFASYNFTIHYSDNEEEVLAVVTRLTLERLRREYLKPYKHNVRMKFGGKLIHSERVTYVHISKSLLKDNEIPLFGLKYGFEWSTKHKDSKLYSRVCQDVTDELFENPDLEKIENIASEKTHQDYIDSGRIKDLESLSQTEIDVSVLIQLCYEINSAWEAELWFSVSSNVRTLLHHIPPIFGYDTFAQVAANHGGNKTKKSFKGNAGNLLNSLKHIADNNLHQKAGKAATMPNQIQVNFSPDLDVVLGEVIRILKEKE
jgi:hypothetical protein